MKLPRAFIQLPLLGWPALLTVLVVAILQFAGSPLVSNILATTLLWATACPIMAAIGPRQTLQNPPLFIATAAIGLVLMGCIATLAEALGLSPEPTISIYLALGMIICLVRAWRSDSAEQLVKISNSSSPALMSAATIIAVALVSVSLVYSFRMGSGPFPAVFYQVDNPYHLSMVRSLIASNQFPPASLNYIGLSPPYEYAMLNAAAMVSRLSGLAPHTSYFLLGLGIITVGICALCWLIAREFAHGWLAPVIMILLYLGTFHQDAFGFAKGISKSVDRLLHHDHDGGLPLALTFNHVLSQAGNLFALFLLYLRLCRSEIRAKTLLVAIVALAPMVKALYFITFCTWMGTLALIEFAAERPWRMPLKEATVLAVQKSWTTIAAFAIGLIVMHIQSFGDAEWRVIFSLFSNHTLDHYVLWNFKRAGILFLPALICIVLTRGRYLQRRTLLALAISVSPALLIFVTALVPDGSNEADFQWSQVAQPATIAFALLAGLLVADSWSSIARWARMVIALGFFIVLGSQTLRFPIMAIDTILHRNHGSEAVDNGDIARALQSIPVNGTLLVTNDLANPGTKHPNLQAPLSAIFGHQCFLSTPAYDYHFPDFSEKLTAQELLQSPNWQPSIEVAAKRYGWTHLLVHKSASYPKDLPLEQIYDSATYAVYRF